MNLMKTGVTQKLAEYVSSFDEQALTVATLEHARQALLDLSGIAIRAAHDVPLSGAVAGIVAELGYGSGPCTVFGGTETRSPVAAALLNGLNFHALDFDDTHEMSSLHPGAPVIAAALAEAQVLDTSLDRLLRSIVAGYDVAVRIGLALNPSSAYARGFHPTAIAGLFGATAAIAYLYRCSAETVVRAFGINLSQAAGSLQFSIGNAETKPLQVGLTAHNAVLAVRLARAGVHGPAEALEGRSGVLHAYSDRGDPDLILEQWDGIHEIDRTAFKPYPCCRYMHAAIDIIRASVERHHLDAESVEHIRVGLPVAGMRLCGEPADVKRAPQLVADAQFSMYYAAAATVAWGSVRWNDYGRRDSSVIRTFVDKVDVVIDPEIEALSRQMAASVEIQFAGVRQRQIASDARGEPSDPLSWNELEAKFTELVDGLISPAAQASMLAIRHSASQTPVSELFTGESASPPRSPLVYS